MTVANVYWLCWSAGNGRLLTRHELSLSLGIHETTSPLIYVAVPILMQISVFGKGGSQVYLPLWTVPRSRRSVLPLSMSMTAFVSSGLHFICFRTVSLLVISCSFLLVPAIRLMSSACRRKLRSVCCHLVWQITDRYKRTAGSSFDSSLYFCDVFIYGSAKKWKLPTFLCLTL